MVAVPPGLPVGTIAGRFLLINQDKADGDTSSEYTAMGGTVKITCSSTVPLQVASQSLMLVPDEFMGEINSDGYLVPVGGTGVGIEVPASSSSVYNPSGFTWKLEFRLKNPAGNPVKISPIHMFVTEGVVNQIADQAPLASSSGVVITRGEKGDPGDLSPVTAGSVTGAITINTMPSTLLWTLTGNVTLTLPTPSATKSGTITLVLTQDATGGRTITWPAGLKWPDAIAQQPSSTAASVSMIHLLWTGTTWVGLLGGKNIA